MSNFKLIETEDGSNSVYRVDLNETYHSFHGAEGESIHVYIEAGLAYLHEKLLPERPFKVLEVGLGTGLNVWLTHQYAASHHVIVDMTSLEPIPLGSEIYQNLNYGKSAAENKLLQFIHTSEWESKVSISKHLSLTKTTTSLEVFQTDERFDVIYFDAFAPSKQPDIWALENLRKCFELLEKGGAMVTYCAQGQFKRNMASAGFKVETLPGAMGKKEMVRGIKPN